MLNSIVFNDLYSLNYNRKKEQQPTICTMLLRFVKFQIEKKIE